MAVVLVLAAAEQRDRLVPRPAAEGVDGLGPDLVPVALHVPIPGQAGVLDREEKVPRGGQVPVPFVDPLAADAAGPEAHDQDSGAVGGFPGVVDPLDFQHLFT